MKKVLGVALLISLLVAGITAVPASADHSLASASINIYRDGINQGSYGGGAESCTLASCTVDVGPMSNRDYALFVRSCGSDTVTVTVRSGQVSGQTDCFGPGPWSAVAGAVIQDETGALTTHDSDVAVTVHAVTQ